MRTAAVLALAAALALAAGCGSSHRRVIASSRPLACPARYAGVPAPPPSRSPSFDARRLLGLRLAAARRLAARYGCSVRVIAVDRLAQNVIANLSVTRIDVDETDGAVSRLVGVY